MGQDLRTAETVLATIGAVLWAILPIPQIVKSFRLKSTAGLSPLLMLLWAISALFISAYAIVRELSLALIIEPHLFGIFAAISWCQCLFYESGLSLRSAVGACLGFFGLWGFIEVTSIFAMKYAHEHDAEIAVLMYGYASSVCCIVGLIPQYMEIYRMKQVVGISFIFLWIGILGGFFMFASLACREKLDIAAAAVYLSTSALNFGIWVLALILNPRAKRQGISLGQVPKTTSYASSIHNHNHNHAAGGGAIDMEAVAGLTPVSIPTITRSASVSASVSVSALPPGNEAAQSPELSGNASSTTAFEMQLPLPPQPKFIPDSSAPSGYSLAYDDTYSPPLTPLETPGAEVGAGGGTVGTYEYPCETGSTLSSYPYTGGYKDEQCYFTSAKVDSASGADANAHAGAEGGGVDSAVDFALAATTRHEGADGIDVGIAVNDGTVVEGPDAVHAARMEAMETYGDEFDKEVEV